MPMGMPYAKGKMAMQKGKMPLSKMMGMDSAQSSEMPSNAKSGKAPMSKAAMMKQRMAMMRGKK
jgi:hypothetical protein